MSIARLNLLLLLVFFFNCAAAQKNNKKEKTVSSFAVIAYYAGDSSRIDDYAVEKLTHIIYSFCHLKGNRLSVDNAGDTATIHKLVSLKKRYPGLKIILSLGGWGGCRFCSPVFATEEGRQEFATSTLQLMQYFDTDGIDLDWEYPAIEGYPEHAYIPADKDNFTALVQTLRNTLGRRYEIDFAAGGFDQYLQQSIDWKKVMPLIDKVNLMSYDLVNGYSTLTGHHTPLYSTQRQKQSASNAIRYFDSIGAPLHKIIIGAAFYARTWSHVENNANGLYQSGKFYQFLPYNQFARTLTTDSGFVFFRDKLAAAPYAYNAGKKIYATFDDSVSIAAKTTYALDKGLGGIMFWELTLDKPRGGLLDAIDKARKTR